LKKFDGINIIPFVDVMLVLLAIILTTSTLIEKKLLPVSLPTASSSNQPLKGKDITITIKRDGSIFWEDKEVSKELLREEISKLNRGDSVDINCDKDVKFQEFISILDSLKAKGVENISIITKTEDG